MCCFKTPGCGLICNQQQRATQKENRGAGETAVKETTGQSVSGSGAFPGGASREKVGAARKWSGSRCAGGPPPAGERWQGSGRWPPLGPAGPGTHRTSHPANPIQLLRPPLPTVLTRDFSKCKPHPPTKKQCLRKTHGMKGIKLQNGHLRNHEANSKHSLMHSR